MASEERALRDEIGSLAVVDAHEHLYGHVECQPREGVTDFVIGPYVGSLLPYVDRALAERIQDVSQPDRERWRDFLTVWPAIRCTGYGNLVVHMLRR